MTGDDLATQAAPVPYASDEPTRDLPATIAVNDLGEAGANLVIRGPIPVVLSLDARQVDALVASLLALRGGAV